MRANTRGGVTVADEEELMAKKPAAKKPKSSKKKGVSLKGIRKAIKAVTKKIKGVNTKNARALRKEMTTLDRSLSCGQGLFVDIS